MDAVGDARYDIPCLVHGHLANVLRRITLENDGQCADLKDNRNLQFGGTSRV